MGESNIFSVVDFIKGYNDDPQKKEEIISLLGDIPNPECGSGIFEALIEVMASEKKAVIKLAAIKSAIKMPEVKEKRNRDKLIDILVCLINEDKVSLDVKQSCCRILGDIGDNKLTTLFLNLIKNGKYLGDRLLMVYAVDAVAKFNDPRIIKPLEKLFFLSNGNQFRDRIIPTLEKLKAVDSIVNVLSRIDDIGGDILKTNVPDMHNPHTDIEVLKVDYKIQAIQSLQRLNALKKISELIIHFNEQYVLGKVGGIYFKHEELKKLLLSSLKLLLPARQAIKTAV
jgi:hypothetical protein